MDEDVPPRRSGIAGRVRGLVAGESEIDSVTGFERALGALRDITRANPTREGLEGEAPPSEPDEADRARQSDLDSVDAQGEAVTPTSPARAPTDVDADQSGWEESSERQSSEEAASPALASASPGSKALSWLDPARRASARSLATLAVAVGALALLVIAGIQLLSGSAERNTSGPTQAQPTPTAPAAPALPPGPPPAQPTAPPAELTLVRTGAGSARFSLTADQVDLAVASSGECWVKVTADGRTAFVGTLSPGQQQEVRGKSVVVRVGNPPVASVTANGASVPIPPNRLSPYTLALTARR